MPSSPSAIDTLLRLVPEHPDTVLTHLASNPDLAAEADSTGYSLLHAATSYSQLDLLRKLVKEFHVSPNIRDSEGETPLFAAETVAAAQCLVQELGADASVRNEEGATAEENANANMEDGGEWMLVADYLEKHRTGGQTTELGPAANEAANGDIGDATIQQPAQSDGQSLQHPPPLPPGVTITGMRTVTAEEGDLDAPDPEFRRRIEELAARDDFQDEAGQKELKNLVTEAIGGLAAPNDQRDVRRRVD